jgi:hypothetical protein
LRVACRNYRYIDLDNFGDLILEKQKPMVALFAIFTIAWLLVLVGTIVIFKFIVPFHYWGGMYDSVTKGALTTILALVWLYTFGFLRSVFVKRNILTKKQESIGS